MGGIPDNMIYISYGQAKREIDLIQPDTSPSKIVETEFDLDEKEFTYHSSGDFKRREYEDGPDIGGGSPVDLYTLFVWFSGCASLLLDETFRTILGLQIEALIKKILKKNNNHPITIHFRNGDKELSADNISDETAREVLMKALDKM